MTQYADLDLDWNNQGFMEELETMCKKHPHAIKYYEEEQGFSLLVMALSMNKLSFAEWLVDNGAEVNVLLDGTPLGAACLHGNPKIIKKVLDKCNDKFKKLINPLEQAIYSTNTTHIDILLKNGYDINEKDNYGYTPLYHAISSIEDFDFQEQSETILKRQFKMLEHVISKGAVLDEASKNALTYLFEITNEDETRNVLSTVSYFINSESKKNEEKEPPLLFLLEWLLKQGANTNIESDKELSFLSDLVSIKNNKAFEMALPFTKVNLLPAQTQFNLIAVAYDEHKVELLLKSGIDPNVSSQEGGFILHYCLQYKKFNFASLLLQYGASYENKNQYNIDVLLHLLCYARVDNESLGALQTLHLIMKQKPNLLDYKLDDLILESNIKDIFDIAVERRVYHWFEPYASSDSSIQMTNEEKWLYQEKGLYNLMHEDNPPIDIMFKNRN
ncbi:ankyrin repeat domain-containing protein [Bacillus thuringiensis]|uniref:ankyrin repeat domain-containing protein n=1 Tax=Bacillus thuringiensis TaxID=1428 RepID=UPI0021D66E77|nr:ankyrin repeat domain-containing protein [Bacillus thuringiensis]MCU7667283.1 ankyrin repeat domain-containing protein [Bacillus thuringiensis]